MTQQRIEQAAQKELEDTLEVTMNCQCANIAYEEFLQGVKYALTHQWIPVDKELPPIDEEGDIYSKDVIVKNEYGKTTTAWYDYSDKDWHICYGEIQGDDLIYSKITHWMEIPPLEGGEE